MHPTGCATVGRQSGADQISWNLIVLQTLEGVPLTGPSQDPLTTR
jgi:hypothetical protein